ncbi:MAG: tetratricopeptide repeat protein [Halocynthiibacter sp.]
MAGLRIAALIALMIPSGMAHAEMGLAGSYLSGRAAIRTGDYSEASHRYAKALVRAPKNATLMDQTILAFIGTGEIMSANQIAFRRESLGETSLAARMAIFANMLKTEKFDEVKTRIKDEKGIDAVLDQLVLGWIAHSEGEEKAAAKWFKKARSNKDLELLGAYNQALYHALIGDFKSAAKAMDSDVGRAFLVTRNGMFAYVQILSQLGRFEDAKKALTERYGVGKGSEFSEIYAKLVAGEAIPFDVISSPEEGFAEAFYSFSRLLNDEGGLIAALLYGRIAIYLNPQNSEAILLVGSIFEVMEQYKTAAALYARIAPDNSSHAVAEMARANIYRRLEDYEKAITILQDVARVQPMRFSTHWALGEAYHAAGQAGDAILSYDTAISKLESVEPHHWRLFYTRATALHSEGIWPRAEEDFLKVLELSPDEPSALNYLGYSYLERNENLDTAMEMIEKAAKESPGSGAITDSLGWAHFLIGNYDQAVVHLEAAVVLMATDPVVNDHLGDAYWAVGRKREARFQWRRALSFDPIEKDETRISQKLDAGLDTVLAEEGAAPLAASRE